MFLHKSPSTRWFTNEIHSLSRAEPDARGSADIVYRM